jgi:uncharacterized membrane protein YbhN (UPF0104 family)
MLLLILMVGLILALAGLGTDHIWWAVAGTLTVGVQVGRAVERIIWASRLIAQRMRSTMRQVRYQVQEFVGVVVLVVLVALALIAFGHIHH